METHLSIMSQAIDRFERDLFFTYSPMPMLWIYDAGEAVIQQASRQAGGRESRGEGDRKQQK